MERRDFIKIGSVLAASAGAVPGFAVSPSTNGGTDARSVSVNFVWDGDFMAPGEYAALLMRLADEGKIKADYYSNGGVVEELEHKFAALLGKDAGVFMPTGTLANQIAVRQLAAGGKRVVVPADSHLYNDSGDCAQVLSHLNLVPLGEDKICFSVDELAETVGRTKSGRVEARVGALMVESPLRRQRHRMVSFEHMQALATFAHSESIKLHLDGARLFIQCAHTGRAPLDYGALFDTVYISMWKCFNAASGAVLTGPKSLTDGLFHVRRMFGGGLPFAWPFAAVALHFADSYISDYQAAREKANQLFKILEEDDRFKSETFEGGTHLLRLFVRGADLGKFQRALEQRDILLRPARGDSFFVTINPSLNRMPLQQLVDGFQAALRDS